MSEKPVKIPLEGSFLTHKVINQPPELIPYNAWETDQPLKDAVAREGATRANRNLRIYGSLTGGDLTDAGRFANENNPKLLRFNACGMRIDEVEFHPSYHYLMTQGIHHGVSNFSWNHADQPGANVTRMALFYLHNQADQGTSCPLTMTYASIPVIRLQSEIARDWLPRILSGNYDPNAIPAWKKKGNTLGMGMTEKQGGSDLRTNTTSAKPLGVGRGSGNLYRIVGHKWFYSAPMSDAHLVLANSDGGLSCFLLPRYAPDERLNAVHVQQLKRKLGDWSNASVEVEFKNAVAWMVGEEGRGVAIMLKMVALTRQDCIIGSCGIMRQALVRAIHYARYRRAFGKRLIKQPLMKNVLADLSLEVEGHTALAARIARAVGLSDRDSGEAAFSRIATSIGKYWICKRTVAVVTEAQECLGGRGYIEENTLPRLYRQAPLNSIWEGCSNIQCLDVLRAISKEARSRDALFQELDAAHGSCLALDSEVEWLARALDDAETREVQSRLIVERAAVALQASILVRSGKNEVADAFCESRLGDRQHGTFGTLPHLVPMDGLVERAFPGK